MSAQVPRIGHDRDGMLAAMRYMRQAFSDGRAASVNRVAEDDKVVVQDVLSEGRTKVSSWACRPLNDE